jgi:Cytochrome P460
MRTGPAVLVSAALCSALAISLKPDLQAPAAAQPACGAEQAAPLLPADPALCARLAPVVRRPAALPLREYEEALGAFLRNFCHRDAASGWKRDKRLRDTGPFTATLANGQWTGAYHGTHAPVVVWYSPEMLAWMKDNRPPEESAAPADPPPIPDGAVIVKEMYPAPAAACAGADPLRLLPTSGAAVMVRDREAAQDGWFWGWFGWSGWDPDEPSDAANRYPYMGFGQYCVNCHASAANNQTFASLRNVEGEPGEPLVFLSQHFFDSPPVETHHRLVSLPTDDAPRLGQPHYAYNAAFTRTFPGGRLFRPSWETVSRLPSETYDNVWVKAGKVTAASQFVTSSQCLGCHDAGGTGLQFDMTRPNPQGDNLLNLSPYSTWKTSPMGLGGRDPVFYAQLASETETFHPESSKLVQSTCLGCHGIAGQRQFEIDRHAETGKCPPFLRETADAVPYPAGNPQAHLADYGALARDGISCTACHRMLAGQGPENPAMGRPENACVDERQEFLNPHNTGFAKTFTGSFLVGPPDELFGPFEDPRIRPMEGSLGVKPVHTTAIRSSEVCGSCHTVHLPVMSRGKVIGHTYEQTTYPEWAFSAYRTGDTPTAKLPGGAGALAESCQSCHMPSKDASGKPNRSKIAGIQERSNFPQAEYAQAPEDIDLPVREGFAYHTLVGLNVFLVKMAQQFPDVLGLRTQDPMLGKKGLDPLLFTEQAMLDQASHSTARIALATERKDGKLQANVKIQSDVGHKLPSGVGFRRAFFELSVLDYNGNVLWASGRTNGAGVIVDDKGDPVAGELWWKSDCSARLHPDKLVFQPHYQVIRRQDQAQIYQELVTAPAGKNPKCGLDLPARPPLTTSFLSICGRAKDNRILPTGFLGLPQRIEIAKALGAGEDLARDVEPHDVEDDPDYRDGGGDSLVYEIDLAEIKGTPATVQATLYYQAIPPFYLQDRFCTSKSQDTQRLYFLAGHLNLEGTEAESWKLELVSTGRVGVM